MSNEKLDHISWDSYFMSIAILSSLRSKDPRTKVGAVIVNEDNHILSTGYNGTPRNMPDEEMPWESLGEINNDILNIKNTYVVHAEANALTHFNGNMRELEKSRMYVTLFPCNECAKLISNYRIKEVIYLQDYLKKSSNATKIIFNYGNITYRKFNDIDSLFNVKEKLEDTLKRVLKK